MTQSEPQKRWTTTVALLAVFSGHAALSLIYDALPPVLAQLAKHFGGGERGEMVAQLASSLPFGGVIVAGLLAPYSIRSWGIRKVLLTGLAVFGLFGSLGALIDDATTFLAIRFLLGVSVGAMLTCCVSSVALAFDEVTRARMTGWLLAFGCFSAVALILVSGYVAGIFGWRAPFFLHAAVSAVFFIPVLCMDDGLPAPSVNQRGLDLGRLRSALPVFTAAIFLQMIVATFLVQLAFRVASLPCGTPEAIAWVFAVIGCAAGAAAYSYGRWFVLVRPPLVAAGGFLLMAAATLMVARAQSLEVFLAAAAIYGSGSATTQASLFTWAMQRAPPELTTRAMGLMFTSLYLGAAIGPASTTRLPHMLGIGDIFLTLVAVSLAGLGLAVFVFALKKVRLEQRSRRVRS